MSLADQINQIRKLAAQGKTESEIAATVGVEMGDVATVLAGTTAGGPSSSSLRRTIACPFAYNTPNLRTGAALYTPTVGDILHDAWFEVITAWNGTTPFGDVGTFPSWDGWFSSFGSGVDFLQADLMNGIDSSLRGQEAFGNGVASGLLAAALGGVPANAGGQPPLGKLLRTLPASFVTNTPIKVVVSQDGTTTGADPGSTQGAAVLYLDISTPQSA